MELSAVNVVESMIEAVVRASMVCRGCCWHLSPAKMTTGRRLR